MTRKILAIPYDLFALRSTSNYSRPKSGTSSGLPFAMNTPLSLNTMLV